MKDIEEREAFEAWWDSSEDIDNAGPWTPDSPIQFAWAAWRAAVEADRAQRVPHPVCLSARALIDAARRDWPSSSAHRARVLEAANALESALLASTPAQPTQQEPDCQRCNGSGEDPEGYFDQSRGPDGDTHDGPCRDCAGTGAAPQPVERKPSAEQVLAKVLAIVRGYLPPDGMLASAAMSEIIALVDPWPFGDPKGPK